MLLIGVLAVVVGVSVGLARLGAAAVGRSSVQAAADAVALAAVIGGAGTASSVASQNGVSVVSLELSGGVATVTVQRGVDVATARASDEP